MRWLTLEKVERSFYFQILLEEWRWDLFPETRFEDNLFVPFVKYTHLGNRQGLAVQLFNRAYAWLDGGWPSHRHAISHFLSPSTTLWCWQEVSNLANQRVYEILVYRHELFKINFTGVPSSSSPVSRRFVPALSLALSFARTPLSERLERAIKCHHSNSKATEQHSPVALFIMLYTFEFVDEILIQSHWAVLSCSSSKVNGKKSGF